MTNPVDKFLSDAISAARDHADDGVDDGAHTRLRLRESLATSGASRRKRFTLIAAVIASLFGSTAFAYWAGWRPPWSKPEAVVEAPAHDEQTTVSMRLPEQQGSAKVAAPDAVETITTIEKPVEIAAIPDAGLVAEVGPTPAPPAPPPAPVQRTVKPKPRVVKAPPPPVEEPAPRVDEEPPPPVVEAPAPPPPKPQPSADLAAYRHAHDLHFKGTDPQAALAAWDDYLAKYPNGTLALEARYDRALVLVKLSRWSEARAALAPFAKAKAGSYRQKEAAEILAAIRDR
ncbi:MAG: tol-pal system YbgF family protein [Kofleriaceae bacterium]